MNKKGLSGIVTTLIILVIALVAIGVVYVIFNNILGQNQQSASLQSRCLNGALRVTNVGPCAVGSTCAVTIKRDTGATISPDSYVVNIFSTANPGVFHAGSAINTFVPATGTITPVVTFAPNFLVVTNVKSVTVTSQFKVNGVTTSCPNPTTTDF